MRKAAVYCFDNQGKNLDINLNKLNMEGFVMEKWPQFHSWRNVIYPTGFK